MSSRGKKKTTFAKLNRETKLRERRIEKKARKEARRSAPPEEQAQDIETPSDESLETVTMGATDAAPEQT